MDELVFRKILLELGIGSPEFFTFLEGKVHRYPIKDFGWACFPKLNSQDRIIDICIIVPEIFDEQCIRINIHEYAHAFELFNELGQVYVENKDVREQNAKEKELEFLRLRLKRN